MMPKACILQTNPIFKDVRGNQQRASAQLDAAIEAHRDEQQSRTEVVDVILLPEMALTGYCFASRDDIAPYLEDPHDATRRPSIEWAISAGKSLAVLSSRHDS